MRVTRSQIILWAPRILGIGLAIMLGLFAADVFIGNHGILGTLVALVMHLIPSLLVLALVLVGWKHEGIAAMAFIALAVFYASTMAERLAWIVLVAGPLVIVSMLFFNSWWVKTHSDMSARSTGSKA